MEILHASESDLERAGIAIAEGKLVVIPTETVYGLGADVFNVKAVANIFAAKARPSFDPLIIHIADLQEIDRLARSISVKAMRLAERLWPGPLTLILPKRAEVPDLATAGLDTVAVRFPSHPLARKIIAYSRTAVAAPSANPFGYLSPTTAAHVVSMLGDKVDFIVDGGPCAVGVESTVVDMTAEVPVILRPGGMPVERIREVIGDVIVDSGKAVKVSSPGQLDSHYAPHTPLYLVEFGALSGGSFAASTQSSRFIALVFNGSRAEILKGDNRFEDVFCLSESGDMGEAAARLFALLHDFDSSDYDAIFAEKAPEVGLGSAINDRLRRASRK
jgi:L-threonylcarbamoyladenylate synthase